MKKLIYVLTFSVLVLLANACQDLDEVPFIELNADFRPHKDLIQLGEDVIFNQNSTIVATNFSWDFGDGSPISNEPSPIYTYTNIGLYTVRMIANKADGQTTDTLERQVRVLPPTVNATNFLTFGSAESDEFGQAFQPLLGGLIIAGRKNLNTLLITKATSTDPWVREFSNITDGQISATKIIRLFGGGYVVVGHFVYGGLSGSIETDAFILRLDANGNEVWRQINSTSKNETYVSAIEIGDDLLIVGNIANANGSQSKIKIDLYDKATGNLEESEELGNSWSVQDIKFSSDGDFILAANEGDRPMFLRLSSSENLTLLARTVLNFPGIAYGVTELNNRDFAIVGEIQNTVNPDSTNAFVVRMDEFGKEVWRDVLVYYHESLFDVTENDEQELVVVGTHYNPLSKQDVLVAKYTDTSTQEAPTLIKLVGGLDDDVGAEIFRANVVGQIIVLGTTESFGNGRRDIYITNLSNTLE